MAHKIKLNSESLGLLRLSRITEFLEQSEMDVEKKWISPLLQEESKQVLEFLEMQSGVVQS